MFDFAWSELALIAVVALVVIGPKDLPRVMRIVGQWTRRARAIAREFQGSLDQMMREAELDEIKRHMDRASSFNVENEIRRVVDPTGEVQRSLSEPVLTNPLADPP
ncbi:MAG TPA: Sec-independent protein translocase protein TatB, partial [Stellaceae bacterium]|nr:Sec-independent protein translocase protein TatB [Stellaceae bacterium]